MSPGPFTLISDDDRMSGYAICKQLEEWRFPSVSSLVMRWPSTRDGEPFALMFTFYVGKPVRKLTLLTPLGVTAPQVAALYHDHCISGWQ